MRIQSYEDVQFLGLKCPISPNENFFRKPVKEPCFFHSCLSTCQKSKSDISLLMKLEPDFSQACSFCRMLMNHKNFHFTQISDKTNYVIFLKSPKTMFWTIFDHFWSFLPNRNFSKKSGSVTHNYIEPLTQC